MKKINTPEDVNEYLGHEFTIECLICHKRFKCLFPHLYHKHNRMSYEEYRTVFDLPRSRPLAARHTRELMSVEYHRRLSLGDKNLKPLTPELRWKGQHTPKHGHPTYHIQEMRGKAAKGLAVRKQKSKAKIDAIDWDKFLQEVERTKKAAWGLRHVPEMPSIYQVGRKLKEDASFRQKYNSIIEKRKIKNALYGRIMELTSQGKSQREIAVMLGVSETHVGRIRREKKQ